MSSRVRLRSVPLPSTAGTSTAPRRAPRLHESREREEDLRLPEQARHFLATFGSNPCGNRRRPFVLKTFNRPTASWTATPNPDSAARRRRRTRSSRAHLHEPDAMLNALNSGALDISSPLDPTYAPQASTLRAAGDSVYAYQTSVFDAIFNFKTRQPLQLDHLAAVCTPSPCVSRGSGGLCEGHLQGAAVAAYGRCRRCEDPVHAVGRDQSALIRTTRRRPSPCSRVTAGMSCGSPTTCTKPGSGAASAARASRREHRSSSSGYIPARRRPLPR